jgi:PAS domain S-box-containing protein
MIVIKETYKGKAPRFYLAFLVSIILLSLFSPASGQENGNSYSLKVTAAVPRSFPPHYTVNEGGKPVGFGIDVMERVAAITGLKVTYLIMDSWTDVAEAVKGGRADLIPNIGITASRRAWLDYTSPVETFAVSLFVRKQTDHIKGEDDLTGHKVAAVKFNVGVDLLKGREDIELKIFPHAGDAVFKLLSGQVDALVYPVPVLMKMVQEAGVDHRIKTAGKPLLEIKRAIGVRKGNALLVQKLDQAVNRFGGTPEYRKTHVKWFGQPKAFWTPGKLVFVMGGVVLSLFIIMFVWRYHTVSRLNRRLIDTVAELRRTEKELRRTNRALIVLSESNEAVIHATSERDLLDEICRIIVKEGGYRLAWVGFAEEDEGKTIRPVAQWGYEDGYLDTVNHTWADAERGQGPVGTAIRTRQASICKDILNDPSFAPWRKEARERGYSSLISLPLIMNAQCAGALTVYAEEPDAFDIEEEELLTELSHDLAFGIRALRNRSEREQAEKALHDSEERFRTLFECAPDGYYLYDLEGTLIDGNRAAEKIVGYKREELMGRSFLKLNLVAPEQVPKAASGLARNRQGRPTGPDEFILNRKDGTHVPVEISSLPITFKGQTLVLSIARDITKRKQAEEELTRHRQHLEELVRERTSDLESANEELKREIAGRKRFEEALRESEKKYRMLVERMNDGLGWIDEKGSFTYLNDKLCEMLGYSQEELLGHPATDFLDKENRRIIEQELAKRRKGESRSYELSWKRKDGQKLSTVISPQPILDGNGSFKGSFAVITDITQRKQAEEDLRMARAEADAANKAKSDFLASMSHELRTPLNAIIGFSEVLRDQYFGEINEQQADYVNDILQSGKHLLLLVNDILDLSKIEAGKVELEPTRLNVAEVLESSLIMVKEKCMKHGIELRLNISQDLGNAEVQADGRRLKQIMFNLLTNAVTFTPDGGTITLEAHKEERELVISVNDTGIGIAKRNQKKIFEEFYQIRGELASKTPGTGLGLPLTKRLVEMHGGRIWVESEGIKKGSRFKFTLPINIRR